MRLNFLSVFEPSQKVNGETSGRKSALDRRHADGFPKRGVRVDGLTNVHGIRTHLDGQRDHQLMR